ncbi:hypothetical protein Nepgr_005925 [Nepenthes gracilis]|uniref:Smr domain-containing protein n=1 Tax=Nepenthes gracilis TaxID=150966 RepID=A0AAD3S4G6_NEPGR|nr:hypothetical protein Nepgr_005925 [Nepenthes gracilis]
MLLHNAFGRKVPSTTNTTTTTKLASLQQLPWDHSHFLHRNTHSPISYKPRSSLIARCALTKQGQRFLTSIATVAAGDTSATSRMISKFIASSPKSVSLSTLSHLLSPNTNYPHLSSLALPLYTRITESSWFSWNSKLVADVVALLQKQGLLDEAESLTSGTVSRICLKERDLLSFYCNLIDSHTKHKSELGFFKTWECLKKIISGSSSDYVKKRAYKSLVGGFCQMGLPHEAESVINEMRQQGIKPSVFELRSIVEAYGVLGMFDEMLNGVVELESSGFLLDTVCSNMVLSSYGLHGKLSQMVLWMQKAKGLGTGFSIRTYNSVLNSCPTIVSMLQDFKSCPTSIEELIDILRGDEALLVQELIGSAVLAEIIEWNSLESKLDLHGMHLVAAYLIMLQWMEELLQRFTSGQYKIPAKFTVVCGLGKHSSLRDKPPLKSLVKELMLRTRSPLRIDRKNIGCFVAKGKAVKEWLC